MTTGKRNRYLSGLGFTDLLFNTLIGFVFLFVIAFLLIAALSLQISFGQDAKIFLKQVELEKIYSAKLINFLSKSND